MVENNYIGITFIHKDDKNLEYKITGVRNDRLIVSWGKSYSNNVTYDIDTVIKCFKEKIWIDSIKYNRKLKLIKLKKS